MGVVVSGAYAFMADYSGLKIFDISSPLSASLVKHVRTSGYAYGVVVSGVYAYLATSTGLQIIDVSDVDSACTVTSLATPLGAEGVAVSGSHAYIADAENGLVVVDLLPGS